MAEDKNNPQADWQKNSGRPSNFHEKDEDLKKDGDGNLKLKKDKDGLTKEQNESIKDTLDSLNEEENEN